MATLSDSQVDDILARGVQNVAVPSDAPTNQPYLPDAGRPPDPAPQASDYEPAGGYSDQFSDLRFNPFTAVGPAGRLTPQAASGYDPQAQFDQLGGGGYDPMTGQILGGPDPNVLRNTPQGRALAGREPSTPVPMDYIPERDPSLNPAQRAQALQARVDAERNKIDQDLRAGLISDQEALEKARKLHEQLANQKTQEQADLLNRSADAAEKYYQEAHDRQQQAADWQQKKADQLLTDEQRIQDWALQVPTQQAIYAATMHMTPTLAILAAIGGALTRTSAIAMLGATNGIVQGVTQGNENLYRDSVNKWQTQYDRLKDHAKTVQDVYQGYIDSYKGRADAAEKAAEKTRLVTGDRVDARQLQISNSANLLEEQRKQIDGLEKNRLTLAKIDEAKQLRDSGMGPMNDWLVNMMAGQLAAGSSSQEVFGSRGKWNMPLQEAAWQRAGNIWATQHRDDMDPTTGQPRYRNPDGSYNEGLLAEDSGRAMMLARRNDKAFERAQTGVAAMAARIEGAQKSMENLFPLQERLARELDRQGIFRPYNKLKQDWQLRMNNRLVNQFVMAHENLSSDFQIMSNRGALLTEPERERKYGTWNNADSFGVYMGQMRVARADSLSSSAGYITGMQRQNYDPANFGRFPMQAPLQMSPDYITQPEGVVPFNAPPTAIPPSIGGTGLEKGAAAGMGGGGAGYGGADIGYGPGGPNDFGGQLPPGFQRDQ